MRLLPNEEPQILASGTSGSLDDVVSTLTVIPIVLFMICGLFSGTFIVALLFRRIAIALAVAGPLVFSAIWIWRGWGGVPNKNTAPVGLAVGSSLKVLPSGPEPGAWLQQRSVKHLGGETIAKKKNREQEA